MALDGIVFDLDGTLVDTNATHVRAWVEVFGERGYRIAHDRIEQELGRGGDQFVPALLGRETAEREGRALHAAHAQAFQHLASREGLKAFPQAVELLRACRQRGLVLALDNPGDEHHLRVLAKATAIDWTREVDQVLSSDDGHASSPAPDLVAAAAKKLALHPAQCAMVGHTPFHATAAKHAGIVCIGLRCGGSSERRLLEAGARRVYADPAELLDQIDDALREASPSRLHLREDQLRTLMRPALEAAERALEKNDAPIGSALFDGDGRLLASAHNEMASSQNKTAHAELLAFAKAAGKVPLDSRDLILVSTLEPCVMCTGAAMESAVDTIVYGLRAPDDAGTGRVKPPTSPESQMPRIVGDIEPAASRALLERWLQRNRDLPQAAYVKQLLSSTSASRPS